MPVWMVRHLTMLHLAFVTESNQNTLKQHQTLDSHIILKKTGMRFESSLQFVEEGGRSKVELAAPTQRYLTSQVNAALDLLISHRFNYLWKVLAEISAFLRKCHFVACVTHLCQLVLVEAWPTYWFWQVDHASRCPFAFPGRCSRSSAGFYCILCRWLWPCQGAYMLSQTWSSILERPTDSASCQRPVKTNRLVYTMVTI